jgi:hypothetical protein
MVYVSWILIVAVPAALVALALWLDRRTRRGYGLGLLSVVLLTLDVWFAVVLDRQRAYAADTEDFAIGIVVAVYLLIGLYLTLVLVLGGLAEAIIAQHWLWFALIVVVSVVAVVVILGPSAALVPDVLDALGFSRGDKYLVMLFLPVLATLAYAVTRILRPGDPPRSPVRM